MPSPDGVGRVYDLAIVNDAIRDGAKGWVRKLG